MGGDEGLCGPCAAYYRAEAEAGALRRVITLALDYVSVVQDGGAFVSLNPSGRALVGIAADVDKRDLRRGDRRERMRRE